MKNGKTTIALLLILALLAGCAPELGEEEAPREEYTSGAYKYALLEDGGAEITKYTGINIKLNIPAELNGHPVTSIGDKAFYGFDDLTAVTIPDSVTSIGDYAFSLCEGLTSITLPDSVTSIGDYAFSFCSGLTSVAIPDSVTSIGVNPFCNCENLLRITVSPAHSALVTIDGVLFCKADRRLVCYPKGLTAETYAIPQGIKIIGEWAFYWCSSLTTITIPDSVTSIGDGAFESCRSLTTITIPDSVTSIGDRAFSNCYGLASLTIPSSVTGIGANPFRSCKSLTKITVSPDHPALATIDGVLFSKQDKRLVCYPEGLTAEAYAIPQGINVIGDGALYCCSSLTSVTIPDSVTSISDYAFCWCTGLTTITIPDSVTSIGDGAFSVCWGLASVTIPDSVMSIGEGAFSDCPDLAVTVGRESYARQYCADNGIPYTYPDANDWLNG